MNFPSHFAYVLRQLMDPATYDTVPHAALGLVFWVVTASLVAQLLLAGFAAVLSRRRFFLQQTTFDERRAIYYAAEKVVQLITALTVGLTVYFQLPESIQQWNAWGKIVGGLVTSYVALQALDHLLNKSFPAFHGWMLLKDR